MKENFINKKANKYNTLNIHTYIYIIYLKESKMNDIQIEKIIIIIIRINNDHIIWQKNILL